MYYGVKPCQVRTLEEFPIPAERSDCAWCQTTATTPDEIELENHLLDDAAPRPWWLWGILVSLSLHATAVTAALLLPRSWLPVALPMQSGVASVALVASISSPANSAAAEVANMALELEPAETRASPTPVDEWTPPKQAASVPLERLVAERQQPPEERRTMQPPPPQPARRAIVETAVAQHRPTPAKASVKVGEAVDATVAARASQASQQATGADTPPAPQLVFNPAPEYPAAALAAGQEGRVLLRVRVDVEGAVEDARIERSSGFRLLDEAALLSVRGWRFAASGERGASSEVAVPVRFVIAR